MVGRNPCLPGTGPIEGQVSLYSVSYRKALSLAWKAGSGSVSGAALLPAYVTYFVV